LCSVYRKALEFGLYARSHTLCTVREYFSEFGDVAEVM